MKTHKIWNNYELPTEDSYGEPLTLEYGKWPWGKGITQIFTKEAAQKIAADLEEMISKGEPGIPVYQGHPDVPELASRYPDKGALGWIKKIDVEDDCAKLSVEWDRFPGKGFGWMSPYWGGDVKNAQGGGVGVEIEEIYSVGLVNNPNIRDFRLPNEEAELVKQERENQMKLEEMLKLLGFAEGATPEEIKAKCEEYVKAHAAVKDAEAKASAACADAEKKTAEANKKAEDATKELDSAKSELANAKAEVDKVKAELANSKAEVEKLKGLKTVSVTMQLENQRQATESRMSLVNEIMATKKIDFDSAWAEAKAKKPELFNESATK